MPRNKKIGNRSKDVGLREEIASLLERGDTAAADELQVMAASATSEVAKAARRALHLLDLRGIRPTSRVQDASERPIVAASPASPKAQSIWRVGLLVEADTSGDITFAMARSETSGGILAFIVNASGVIVKVAEHPAALQDFVNQLPVVMERRLLSAHIPADYARYRIHEAARVTSELNALRPIGLSQALQTIGPCDKTFDRALVYESLDVGGVVEVPMDGKVIVREAYTILNTFEAEGSEPFVMSAIERLTSSLVLTDQQLRDELSRLFRSAANRMMPAPVYEQALRRLEDHALLHYLNGDAASARSILWHAAQGRRAGEPAGWRIAEITAFMLLRETTRRLSSHDGSDPDDDELDDESPIIQLPR